MTAARSPSGFRQAYWWALLADLSRQAVLFGIAVVLSRILQPADYGLVGMLYPFLAVLMPLQTVGAAQAVIQFGDDRRMLPLALRLGLGLGLAIFLVLFAAAGWIADFYGTPALAPLLRVMVLVLPIYGLRAPSQGLLLRAVDFRRLSLVDSGGSLGAAALSIWMALAGFGAWALVTHQLLSAVLVTAVLLKLAPPRLDPPPDREFVARVLHWTLPLTCTSILWEILQNADVFVIGRALGSQAVGYYAIAFRLATLLSDRLIAVVGRVSFSTLATMQEDRAAAVRHWFSLTAKISLLALPALTLLCLCAQDLIVVVFGRKWLPAAVPLRFLCALGALRCITPVAMNFLATQGHTRITTEFMLANILIVPPCLYAGARWGGIGGVAMAWVLVYPWLVLMLVFRALRLGGAAVRSYLALFALPSAISLVLAAVVLPMQWIVPPGLARLVASAAAASIGLLVVWFRSAPLRAQVEGFLQPLFAPRPAKGA